MSLLTDRASDVLARNIFAACFAPEDVGTLSLVCRAWRELLRDICFRNAIAVRAWRRKEFLCARARADLERKAAWAAYVAGSIDARVSFITTGQLCDAEWLCVSGPAQHARVRFTRDSARGFQHVVWIGADGARHALATWDFCGPTSCQLADPLFYWRYTTGVRLELRHHHDQIGYDLSTVNGRFMRTLHAALHGAEFVRVPTTWGYAIASDFAGVWENVEGEDTVGMSGEWTVHNEFCAVYGGAQRSTPTTPSDTVVLGGLLDRCL
jgi:hypothetical protein